MDIKFTASQAAKLALVVPVNGRKQIPVAIAKQLGKTLIDQLAGPLKNAVSFEGQKDQFLWVPVASGKTGPHSVLLYGVGDEKTFAAVLDSQKLGGQIYQQCNSLSLAEAVIIPADCVDIQHLALGASLKSYYFAGYKTKDTAKSLPKCKTLHIYTSNAKQAQKDWLSQHSVVQGVTLARDLMNQPPNICTPQNFVKAVQGTLKGSPVKITVLDEKAIQRIGMGALYAVSRGSRNPPRVLIVEYNGLAPATSSKTKTKSKPVALVGKGVTFDTGGYNLKPSSYLTDMKFDMGGAAAVMGAVIALAKSKAKTHVVAIAGLTENLVDEDSYLPGEVLTTLSGQTVEIIDTDAEGRLVLCDLLTYVQKQYDPSAIVDIATLTGAIMAALGSGYAGLFSNNDKVADRLSQSGTETGERCWRLPMDAIPAASLKSPIADLVNLDATRLGGASWAASFLAQFIDEKRPWAHLDIAGMMRAKPEHPICPAGAMGFGVRLLHDFVLNYV